MSTYRDTMWSEPYVTTWTYDSQRGWMTSKIHADATTNSFEYFDNGRLKKRSWARGIDTEYAYDLGGSLTNVDYSDSTADIAYVRDRLGRAVRVTDAIGTWTNTWCDDGQLDQVSLPQLAGGVLDLAHDAAGRLTNVAVEISGSALHQTAYTFDNASRLSAVSDGALSATYAYGPDGATWTNLSLGGPLKIGRTFDGLNRLTQIVNTPSNDTALSFAYVYNSANQRTTNTLADGSYWVYEYDSVGQVTTARKFFPDGMRMPWAQFQYDFDTAANRRTAACTDKDADSEQEYTLNDVNAYTDRTVPGKVIAAGTADSNAVVLVGLGTNTAALANRHGESFWHVLDADNSGGVFSTTNLQVRAFVQTATNSPVRTEVREALLPQASESFTFDADGNQTSCSVWTNLWNGENRLVQVESRSGVPEAQRVRVDYVYDHQGRMTTRTLRSAYSGGAYATTNVTTYVWDAFNILAEITDTGETNLNLWGLDLSGTLQGAGGVGGLLAVTTTNGTHLPTFDGNGNICQYVDQNGTVVSSREYGPFGKTIALTGEKKNDFTHWWSTKPWDAETGQSKYERRDYLPGIGRFTSRDPIGVRGGPNEYCFVQNEPVGRWDYLGLDTPFGYRAPGESLVGLPQADVPSGSTDSYPEPNWSQMWAGLYQRMIALCPRKGETLPVPAGGIYGPQCCNWASCKKQAFGFAGQYVLEVKKKWKKIWVDKDGVRAGGSEGNRRFERARDRGIVKGAALCYEWTAMGLDVWNRTVKPFFNGQQSGSGCFRFAIAHSWAYWLDHNWVEMWGPSRRFRYGRVPNPDMEKGDIRLDPWPSGGAEIFGRTWHVEAGMTDYEVHRGF